MPSELVDYLNSRLELDKIPKDLKKRFLSAMEIYLRHSSSGELKGRSMQYIVNQMNTLIDFLDTFKYSIEEKVSIICNDTSLLNSVNVLYAKYLFLGIVENSDNTFRRDKLLHKTKDFRISIEKLYARYLLACECGYDNINWNLLVHASDNEFAKVFVKGTYYKPYQLFDSIESVLETIEEYMATRQINMEEYMGLGVNQELVLKYESQGRGSGTFKFWERII